MSHSWTVGFLGAEVQVHKTDFRSTFKTAVHVMSANMPLAKASDLARLSINKSGKSTLLAPVGALCHQMQMSWAHISITEKE